MLIYATSAGWSANRLTDRSKAQYHSSAHPPSAIDHAPDPSIKLTADGTMVNRSVVLAVGALGTLDAQLRRTYTAQIVYF